MEDNLYQSQFPQQAVSLRNSLRSTKNILGADILNNAFNAAYPIGDGQSLCSANHPIDGGVFSNALTPADLALASLEDMIIQIQQTPMVSGMLAQIMPKKMVIPPQLQFTASIIMNSKHNPTNANNDINPLYHSNYIPQGYVVNQYLTNPKSWFVITDCPNGLKHYQRTPVETDTYVDFPTDNIMAKAGERYSFGVSDPRAIFGSKGV
jgi:hypothetical protein